MNPDCCLTRLPKPNWPAVGRGQALARGKPQSWAKFKVRAMQKAANHAQTIGQA